MTGQVSETDLRQPGLWLVFDTAVPRGLLQTGSTTTRVAYFESAAVAAADAAGIPHDGITYSNLEWSNITHTRPAVSAYASHAMVEIRWQVPADIINQDTIRRDERTQIARRLRANRAELLATSARTEDAIGLICHQIEFAAVHRNPEPPVPDEDGLT